LLERIPAGEEDECEQQGAHQGREPRDDVLAGVIQAEHVGLGFVTINEIKASDYQQRRHGQGPEDPVVGDNDPAQPSHRVERQHEHHQVQKEEGEGGVAVLVHERYRTRSVTKGV
jgi:hypothetical protein